MKEFQSSKELFDYVRHYDLKTLKNLKEVFLSYQFNFIDINDLQNLLYKDNYLLIDTRSEKEFEETSIPTSINFPVLNNYERHNVGIVYKNYSDLAAVELASEYALPKKESLQTFLKNNNAENKQIFVYCWRGGGRSKFLSKMIFDLGYSPNTLLNGIKSYRNMVNSFFKLNSFPLNLLELNGLTGCGKTDLINAVSDRIPVLNLEKSARHFSSLFGYVPYKIRGKIEVKNQSAFENNLYGEYIYNQNCYSGQNTYIVESESRKVGNFFIPMMIYKAIEVAKCINIESSIESRVKRLINDYFISQEGYEEMLKIFKEKETFFRRELSNVHYNSCLDALLAGNAGQFIIIMLIEYYDLKYKDKGKSPVATVNSDNLKSAAEEIISIYQKSFQT
ncbi:MAG: tRNA 2-selenouridine(34) synthase MnmH [Ignavibacteria bacterium]